MGPSASVGVQPGWCVDGTPTRSFDVRYVEKVVSDNALRCDADLSLIRPAYSTSIGLAVIAPSERFAQQASLNREATVAAASELSESLSR